MRGLGNRVLLAAANSSVAVSKLRKIAQITDYEYIPVILPESVTPAAFGRTIRSPYASFLATPGEQYCSEQAVCLGDRSIQVQTITAEANAALHSLWRAMQAGSRAPALASASFRNRRGALANSVAECVGFLHRDEELAGIWSEGLWFAGI